MLFSKSKIRSGIELLSKRIRSRWVLQRKFLPQVLFPPDAHLKTRFQQYFFPFCLYVSYFGTRIYYERFLKRVSVLVLKRSSYGMRVRITNWRSKCLSFQAVSKFYIDGQVVKFFITFHTMKRSIMLHISYLAQTLCPE